ncbi:regulator of G-protein signaling 6 isoform X4 [Gymnogyps californianus]|uniref:regulator of G-protein signaling 6 isoform X4 n=1 Tax=Gymnogyps californianus TaxID=33616 RepID=UPI0021C9B996|nr:regulator of G-protein signaling 6 isoform X4 [Gymnogyps californianus]
MLLVQPERSSYSSRYPWTGRNCFDQQITLHKVQIEDIITRMQDDKTGGVPIRTVKSFLSKIPSVVTGADIVQWLMKNLSIEDPGEAIHLGSLIAAQGYVFPISDHVLTLKDDGTFYRFQAPYFWPSNCWEPENTDYAIYLCKRTMQNKARLELADYEAENLARLQRAFARKWEFIFMQAEAQVKIDRKKDKTERKILDSQERAFWDVHRPVPGCVNTTEMDIRKCRRMKNPQKVKKSVYGVTEESQPQSPVHVPSQPIRKTTKEDFRKQITFLNVQIERHCLKMSKVAESLIAYTEQYVEYDPFITPAEPSNPWISDDAALWDIEMSKEPSQQRVKRWGFSMDEVLKDPVGRDQFLRFLESEFSSENLSELHCRGFVVVLWCHLSTSGHRDQEFMCFLWGSPVPAGPVVIGRDGQRACSFTGRTVPAPGMRKSAVN